MNQQQKESLKKLDEYFNSPEGIASTEKWLEKMRKEDEIKTLRLERAEAYLVGKDFAVVLQACIDEHTDEYEKKAYQKGEMPNPTHKMGLIFDLANFHGVEIEGDIFDIDFSNSVCKFRGYYFVKIYGQGCIYRIYNSQKEIIFNL